MMLIETLGLVRFANLVKKKNTQKKTETTPRQ